MSINGGSMRKFLCLATVAVCLTVTSCSSGPTVAVLGTDQTDHDVIPGYITGVAPESIRFAAERGDYAFYLARPEDWVRDAEACVVIVHKRDETGWVAACSNVSPAVPMVGQTRGISASVIPDNYDPSERIAEGWEQVHENLLVKGVSS